MGKLITACGRSGTLFLASTLSQSNSWQVMHELKGDYLFDKVNTQLIKRFKKDRYLEVNGYLRNIALDLEIDRKDIFIILRNPIDIFKSAFNRKNNSVIQTIDHLNSAFTSLDKILEAIPNEPIIFKEMVTDKFYILEIAKKVGIFDLKEHDISLRKINATQVFSKSPTDQDINLFKGRLAWFIEKYRTYF